MPRIPGFRYDIELQKYLKERFGVRTEIGPKNWHRLTSGSVLYQINSENGGNGVLKGWFDLSEPDLDTLWGSNNHYMAVVLREGTKLLTSEIAIISNTKIKELCPEEVMANTQDDRLTLHLAPHPYQYGYILRANGDKRQTGDIHRIDQLFNWWEQIPDFSTTYQLQH